MTGSGARALGVAFSGSGDETGSLVAGAAVVRPDRVVDGLAADARPVADGAATALLCRLLERIDRPDATHLLLAGVAPTWFDVVDLDAVHDAADRPVLAVSFEASDGLGEAIDDAFADDATARASRRARYDALPDRHPVSLSVDGDGVGDGGGDGGGTGTGTGAELFVRAVGCSLDRAARVVRRHTPASQGRPEPLRVARLCARASAALLDGAADDGTDDPDVTTRT